jgi:hypothetical protein
MSRYNLLYKYHNVILRHKMGNLANEDVDRSGQLIEHRTYNVLSAINSFLPTVRNYYKKQNNY